MPIPTPFHPRTSRLCESYAWKEWAGYHAVRHFASCHEPEYVAYRHACGLLDVSPLYKYRIGGRDAAAFLSRVLCRDVRPLQVHRVAYSTWCDDRGKILDDGTVTRLDDSVYRLTSAEPALAWLQRHVRGFDVHIEEVSARIAALAIQGPTSRAVLHAATDANLDKLRFFGHTHALLDGVPVEITRTGYTGDLGYELWLDADHALTAWDALMHHGTPHGLLPAGLDALDMTRVEAGFVLNGVDYTSARDCRVASQMSTPFELDLGWTVHLEREPFVGQRALLAEHATGPRHAFVGLDIDWNEIDAMFGAHGLPPSVPVAAWRDARPVYHGRRQVGRATSGTWSPTLKKNLALATVERAYSMKGSRLEIEVTVEYERRRATAVVTDKPFFDPPRKRA